LLLTTTLDYSALFAGVQTEVLGAVQAIIPLAVIILGVLAGITIAVKLYRRFAK
jgi:uncharacterized membrane protein YoaK (UPF0700 family)